MEMIIDAHCHVGDLLNPNGGKLIEKTGIKNRNYFDSGFFAGLLGYRTFGEHKQPNRLIRAWATYSGRKRNFAATRENMRKSMDKSNIDYSCCMPISPNVNFNDLYDAKEKDSGIIPFTSVDFSRFYDFDTKLCADVWRGARGLKLHPIIQNTSLLTRKSYEVIESFQPYGLPILFHSGVTTYYHGEEKKKECPSYGKIGSAKLMIRDFPNAKFIIGHAGLFEVDQVIDAFSDCKNVYVDTSSLSNALQFFSDQGLRVKTIRDSEATLEKIFYQTVGKREN